MSRALLRLFGRDGIGWGLLPFLLAWGFASTYVLHHFYTLGGMRDSLWFAGLAHHGDLAMSDPPSVAFMPRASFFHTHFSPLFYIPSALSQLSSMPPASWYALWYGLVHALLAWCFWLLVAPLAQVAYPTAGRVFAAVLALLFALNGNAMMAMQMPHYELLAPALLIGVMALLARSRGHAAMTLLCLAVLVREDAGLHAAALLIPAAVWRLTRPQGQAASQLDRQLLKLGLVALLGATACLAIQKMGWGDNGMLMRNYLGQPPLAHLTAEVWHARWQIFVAERSYLWLPFVLACLWALLERQPLLVWGFVAYLPWQALQFVAKEEVMGTLSWYYAFPAIASLAWPIMAQRLSGPYAPARSRRTLWWMGALLLSTLVGSLNGQALVYPWAMLQGLRNPVPAMQADEAFMQVLAQQASHLGQLRLDNGVIALRPRLFAATQRAEAPQIESQAIDTLAWFDPGGFDSQSWSLAESKGLRYRFAVPQSPIVIASRFDLLRDAAWRSVLVPTNLFARRTQTSLPAGADGRGWRVDKGSAVGVLLSAPLTLRQDGLYQIYSPSMPPGRYQLDVRLRVQDFGNSSLPLFILRRHHNWAPQFNEELQGFPSRLEPLGGNQYRFVWPLIIQGQGSQSGTYWPAMMQIEWLNTGQAAYTIESWSLTTTQPQP